MHVRGTRSVPRITDRQQGGVRSVGDAQNLVDRSPISKRPWISAEHWRRTVRVTVNLARRFVQDLSPGTVARYVTSSSCNGSSRHAAIEEHGRLPEALSGGHVRHLSVHLGSASRQVHLRIVERTDNAGRAEEALCSHAPVRATLHRAKPPHRRRSARVRNKERRVQTRPKGSTRLARAAPPDRRQDLPQPNGGTSQRSSQVPRRPAGSALPA